VHYQAEELPRDIHARVRYSNGIPLRRNGHTERHIPSPDANPDRHVADVIAFDPPTPPLRMPSSVPPTPTPSTSDIVRCGQCHVSFTGMYRQGNLGRHLRHKHKLVEEVTYSCTVGGCHKVFARKDARLKHARKHHPGLHCEPVKRRQGNEAAAIRPRKVRGGQTPHRLSDNKPIQPNSGSGFDAIGTSTRMAYITELSDSRGQAFQPIDHIIQPGGDAVPDYDTADRPLHSGERRDLSDGTYHQEDPPSSQYLHPPRADWTYRQLSPLTTTTGYYSSTGMSTQQSNQGFGTATSSYFHPMHSESTSVQGLEDPVLYSPSASPCRRHPARLQSQLPPYSASLDIPPIEESLPQDYLQHRPGSDASILLSHIDPELFPQSLEWPSLLDEELW
jgi:hypothetical protein